MAMEEKPESENAEVAEAAEQPKEGLAALEALKESNEEVEKATPAEPQIDDLGRSYATGRRKNASARVWVKRGSGQIEVNGKEMKEYFARPVLQMLLAQPFEAASSHRRV